MLWGRVPSHNSCVVRGCVFNANTSRYSNISSNTITDIL